MRFLIAVPSSIRLRRSRRFSSWVFVKSTWLIAVAFLFVATPLKASDQEDAQNHLRTGNYQACIDIAKAQVEKGVWNEVWPRILIEAYLTTGQYAEALASHEKALERYADNIRLRLLGVRVYRHNNDALKAEAQLEYIDQLLARAPWRLNSRSDLVPLGDYFLQRGEDPKQVLKICYDQALKSDPKSLEAFIATAKMALDKNDAKVASQALEKAVKIDETDPEIHFLLAKTWSSSDSKKATVHMTRSLELNPQYVPSLIYQAEMQMSAEEYQSASSILDRVETVNANLPTMWALRAAIAHLTGRYEDEGECRKKALRPWSLNPEVDFTIGKHLSMHYRFSESVTYQQRALKMKADYVPAVTQLAQDLLRLGDTDAGWPLVDAVRKSDPYDVTIFNLKQLQTQLQKFATLEAPGFVVRMDAREAAIYGTEVLQLLSEARDTLTKKYEIQLEEPIFVEIFPKQKEFAIRTFGMPGGEGFLGVCFGRLITANSPAALNVDSNWKSVLWHEYCHVVTLQKSKNKMPRWLSEGISVYEERQHNATWGQSMDRTYRSMILGEDFVPMSKLSGAFLQPKTPMHLQFAYYEASLAIEFWIEKYGVKSLIKLLDDLSIGMPASEALKRAPGTLELLDKDFQEFAFAKANAFGKGVDLSQPTAEDRENMPDWLAKHSESYLALSTRCRSLINAKKWTDALEIAEELKTLLPDDPSDDGVYAMLATIHRAMENTELERTAWLSLAERSADCRQALMRLIEIDTDREDWPAVSRWCERMIEIDPMRSDVQAARAQASEQTNAPELAAKALAASIELDPIDPAGLHFRLAKSLYQLKRVDESKRHALMALEESPRFLEALELLKQIAAQQLGKESATPEEPTTNGTTANNDSTSTPEPESPQ